MKINELVKAGQLADAVSAAERTVRSRPADTEARLQLYAILCVAGEWERARTHLDAAASLDPKLELTAITHRVLLACETARNEVFSGRATPTLFGEPEPWMIDWVKALTLTQAGQTAASASVRDTALDQCPETPGTLDGRTVTVLQDGDGRIGPFVEAFVQGKYFWVPVARIKSLRCEAPASLLDLVWFPARFTWKNGGEAPGYIPARYAGSEKSENVAHKLGRLTEWHSVPGTDWSTGVGQRMFYSDAGEHPLLELRAADFA